MHRPKPNAISRSHKMRFGAELRENSTRFKIWAPKCKSMKLRIKGQRGLLDMDSRKDGWHKLDLEGIKAGALYKFVLPNGQEIADPATRYQPDDVHGFSEVIDPRAYPWTDVEWLGRPWEEAIIYELHVGTFTEEGTFRAAAKKLAHLVKLGVTAIQIMPLADFYGKFNWGYDGVMWFAPDSSYGRPEDLKALVDAAHDNSLMVFLDVVFNHFGPNGNFLPAVAPIFTKKHTSPWGEAINFDAEGAATVRELTIEAAIYWITEFHFDGLRLDAVHAIRDDSSTHILEILAARVRAAGGRRHVHMIVENSDNQERWLRRNSSLLPVHYTAQWNDDVHHLLHAAATGENTGYYADFENLDARCHRLGRALSEGFAYQGEIRPQKGERVGEPSVGLPATAFVTYMQDHDQIGNRIHGDRINSLAHGDAIKALTAVYLLLPQIPMLFMGEEWATEKPFPFFADVPADMREVVLKGRQEELKNTPEHEDPSKPNVEDAVDPTLPSTFASAKLDWDSLRDPVHADWFLHYRQLIDIRKMEIIPRLVGLEGFSSRFEVLGLKSVLVTWFMGDGTTLRLYANLNDEKQTGLPAIIGRRIHLQGFLEEGVLGPWSVLWTVDF